jgi:hypothetical protein
MPDLLQELVDFESNSVYTIPTDGGGLTIEYQMPKTLPLTNRDILQVKVILEIRGESVEARMNRVFIHQIGKRIYGELYQNEYLPLFHNWVKDFNEDNEMFTRKIKSAIIENKLIVKYIKGDVRNKFYGFISSKFEDTNQLGFRGTFHQCAEETNKIITEEYSQHWVKNTENKVVKEYYRLDTGNTKISLSCGVVYGLNNGYGAYSTHWIRKFVDSEVWLAPWKSETEFKWRNNPRFHDDSAKEEMESFVKFVVEEGTKHSMFIEKKIDTAGKILLEQSKIKDFYDLLRVAKATEDRIDDMLKSLVVKKGNTLLTYAESMCHVGTFDKYTGKEVKRLLIATGTRLLMDEGFDVILKAKKEIVLTGEYDWY